jgi:hypothetical protein
MSTAASVITHPPSPVAARARHGVAGVVAQYIHDLAHPPRTA